MWSFRASPIQLPPPLDQDFQSSNSHPFADVDAAYTLAFAVTMLNTDQHNKNHTRINEPMTIDQFKRNLRGTNGPGGDFDHDMLAEIYQVSVIGFRYDAVVFTDH